MAIRRAGDTFPEDLVDLTNLDLSLIISSQVLATTRGWGLNYAKRMRGKERL